MGFLHLVIHSIRYAAMCEYIIFFIFSHVPVPLLFRNTIHFKLLRRVDRGNICPGVEKVRQWLGEVSGVRDKRIQASLQVRPLKKNVYFHFFKFLTNFNCLCKYFSLKAVLPTVLWAGASFFFYWSLSLKATPVPAPPRNGFNKRCKPQPIFLFFGSTK